MDYQPLLLFIRGIPGSGKSFLARALASQVTTILDPDAIDDNDPAYMSFASNLKLASLDPKIIPFRWLKHCAIESAQLNSIILWNQPFTDKGVFERLVESLKNEAKTRHNTEPKILLIEMTIDENSAWKRVMARKYDGGHGPEKDIFQQRVSAYKSYADTFDVLELRGDDPIEVSVQAVLNKIHEIQSN